MGPRSDSLSQKILHGIHAGIFVDQVIQPIQSKSGHLHAFDSNDMSMTQSLKSLLNIVTLLEDFKKTEGIFNKGLLAKDLIENIKIFTEANKRNATELGNLTKGLNGHLSASMSVMIENLSGMEALLNKGMKDLQEMNLTEIAVTTDKLIDAAMVLQSLGNREVVLSAAELKNMFKDVDIALLKPMISDQFFHLYRIEKTLGLNTETLRRNLCEVLDANNFEEFTSLSKNKLAAEIKEHKNELSKMIKDIDSFIKNKPKENYIYGLLGLQRQLGAFFPDKDALKKSAELDNLIIKELNIVPLVKKIDELNKQKAQCELNILRKSGNLLKEAAKIVHCEYELKELTGLKATLEKHKNIILEKQRKRGIDKNDTIPHIIPYKAKVFEFKDVNLELESKTVIDKLSRELQGDFAQCRNNLQAIKQAAAAIPEVFGNQEIQKTLKSVETFVNNSESVYQNVCYLKRTHETGSNIRSCTLAYDLCKKATALKAQSTEISGQVKALEHMLKNKIPAKYLEGLKKNLLNFLKEKVIYFLSNVALPKITDIVRKNTKDESHLKLLDQTTAFMKELLEELSVNPELDRQMLLEKGMKVYEECLKAGLFETSTEFQCVLSATMNTLVEDALLHIKDPEQLKGVQPLIDKFKEISESFNTLKVLDRSEVEASLPSSMKLGG